MKEEKKEETIDRRIRKTRRLLRECLTALLKEKKGSGYYGKGNCRYGRHQSWNLLPAL